MNVSPRFSIPPMTSDLRSICARLISRASTIERLQREQDTDLRDTLRLIERMRRSSALDPASLRLLSMSEVEDLTGISRTTLYKLIDAGELPAKKVGGSWRISVADYRAWVSDGGVE